ncbi:unnamed protein product [Cylindrotheca closterium]|uniref:Protein HIRA-like C-terminal domain-containing protein n=1 Tax=Cylindrotheca closterium TaxID=2856 RepID=A0AAD2CZP8_9STRA|nr:unnamed protein product [Cylindrotheca closterium]
MVVAEVPLWVVHSNNASAYEKSKKPSNDGPNSASANHSGSDHHHQQRAKDSLALLEGLGGASKASIYSVDIHPDGTKFATGGGDGKVRLWNSSALFAPAKSKYSKGGNYESSGESSFEDNDNNGAAGNDIQSKDGNNSSSSSLDGQAGLVHDLSSMVRKKKNGSSSAAASSQKTTLPQQEKTSNQSSSLAAAAAATATTTKNPLTSSSHRKSHHHHHHQHRLLCTLSAHTGSSVLAVRFSTSGQYLASAGDDAAVCIYAKSSNASGNLDSSVEQWNRIKLCRGHALDAVGLAWAPDDSHLVSCSLDSNAPIIVWKLTDLATVGVTTHSNVLQNPYKILGKGLHTSTVKGVTFDPAGTYLASSGDDPSVCIWRAHDDWGLEKRIDANDGIFRRWKENDSQSLSSQSMFRRLSWSTDGSYICSTNAVVKNKHVASTISREGWAVSNSKSSSASGAANLVGHKQPVVVCRHCPLLLNGKSNNKDSSNEEDDDEDPEYGNLLALGDKRGFVTVWSTRKSRPVFKIQCSETRCTVTDMAWGKIQSDLMLIVSLLDGQVVALRFSLPQELGRVLKPKEQAKVFQMRYGIDIHEMGDMGERRLFVGENSGPKFIENALQLDLEDDDDDEGNGGGDDNNNDDDDNNNDNMSEDSAMGGEQQAGNENPSADQIRATQIVARSKNGKKRVQPLLMTTTANSGSSGVKKQKLANGGNSSSSNGKKKTDTLKDAMELAEKAASGAEAATTTQPVPANRVQREISGEGSQSGHHHNQHTAHSNVSQHNHTHLIQGIAAAAAASSPQIPYSTNRVHSTDLPCSESEDSFVADCTNSTQVPNGSTSNPLPCTMLSISSNGKKRWFDQLPGTSCSSIAASERLLVVGTADGSVHLYGTSPSMGWSSCTAFRSHPPFILGRPIVTVQIHKKEASDTNATERTDILVVTADGSFGVYSVIPELRLRFKGTIMPPMTHMLLASNMSTEIHLPRLARLQLTDTDRLLLLLSLQSNQGGSLAQDNSNGNKHLPSVGVGGSLQAFVYSEAAELWMRVADGRFVLSDFYSTLPLSKRAKSASGELSKLEDAVRMGANSSTLKAGRRGRSHGHADSNYNQTRDESGNDIATRSHCEDRMACALALGSAAEFKHWLSMYARTLAMCGYESMLRVLVDMLLGNVTSTSSENGAAASNSLCWWLSNASNVLDFNRKKLVTSIVIPEMSKNRALQRITNEISVEVKALP